MSQAPNKKTYVERSTEIVKEMQAYRSFDGNLHLTKETADMLEKYIIGLSTLIDARNKTIYEILPLAREITAARKSV